MCMVLTSDHPVQSANDQGPHAHVFMYPLDGFCFDIADCMPRLYYVRHSCKTKAGELHGEEPGNEAK